MSVSAAFLLGTLLTPACFVAAQVAVAYWSGRRVRLL